MTDQKDPSQSTGLRFFPSTWAGRCGLISIAWGLLMIGGWLLNNTWKSEPPVNRPIQAIKEDYSSAVTCRSCHPGNYASWHASYHRTMTQVASAQTVASDMDGLELTYDGTDYRVDLENDSYYVRTKKEGRDESEFSEPSEIVLLTGSHNLQVYWLETGEKRTMEQFPFGYIVAEKKWAPMVQTFLVPPGPKHVYTKGDWNDGCINCHVTVGRGLPVGDRVFDSRVSDFGIACEACHDGGREHIERNRDPLHRFSMHLSDGADQTIANPAHMDGPTASLVCGQCHSIWTFNNAADTGKWDLDGTEYRPGHQNMKLRSVVQPIGEDGVTHHDLLKDYGSSFWGDGQIRVTGRELNGTMASPCFKGGKFSCLSCHDLHPDKTDKKSLQSWAVDQMGSGMKTDQACLQCHQDFAANIPAHTNHAVGSSGSSCYNCHMPHSSYGLLRAIRSHQITSPTVRESIDHGRPNACNLCHLDQTLEWTAHKLSDWYGHDIPVLEKDDRELSAGAKWILNGDAGQRALIAWAMGWDPAKRASGYKWFYPFLIFELNDPYAAVRFVSWKSLQSLPGFYDYPYDYTVEDPEQKVASAKAYRKWWEQVRDPKHTYKHKTLLQSTGHFRQQEFERLLNTRDNTEVYLIE